MAATAFQTHHMVPEKAVELLSDFYIRKTPGASSAAANAWAKSLVFTPLNEIPLPTSPTVAKAMNLPRHYNGPLPSYQSEVLDRVNAMLGAGATISSVEQGVADLEGALRILHRDGLVAPNNGFVADPNALNAQNISATKISQTIAGHQTEIADFKAKSAVAQAGTEDAKLLARLAGYTDGQLSYVLETYKPSDFGRSKLLSAAENGDTHHF